MSRCLRIFAAASLLLPGSPSVAAGKVFVRGDCNADGDAGCSVTDPIFLLSYLFAGSEKQPPCVEACNVNDDADLDISDAVYMLLHCFSGGPAPPPPHPACGEDPDPASGLGCAEFPPCAGVCAPQDAQGVGACDAIVGIFWDGFRCRWHSGCSCEGKDCDESFQSVEACYAAHAACASACDPMDVHEVGTCEPVHGYFWDGKECKVLSGCECGGTDCDKLFRSPDDCAAAHAGCQ